MERVMDNYFVYTSMMGALTLLRAVWPANFFIAKRARNLIARLASLVLVVESLIFDHAGLCS